VTGCTAMTGLNCSYNSLSTLDVSTCTALTGLDCYNNSLTTLTVTGCTAMTYLNCFSNSLTVLSVNTTLFDMDSIATLGSFTGGTIDTSSQTPAAPPDTGPPNGVAAKADLITTWSYSVTTD
jgi:hypothetical protein